MNTELDYLNKCIKFMEDTPPSKFNPAIILKMKLGFIPRLKDYLNGLSTYAKDLETPETQQEMAERVMNEIAEPTGK